MRLQFPSFARCEECELLRLLRADPRIGVSELARRVGMSAPAVRERMQRLEESGVISGHRVELDPKALGYPIAAYIRVRPMPGKMPKIAELAREHAAGRRMPPHHRRGLLHHEGHVQALDGLDRMLDRFLAHGQTTTSLIQSSPVLPRGLPLPG